MLIAAKLYGRVNLSMKAAEEAMEDIHSVLNLTFELIEQEIKNTFIPEQVNNVVINCIRACKEQVIHSLKPISTEQRITTALERKGFLKLPERVVFNEKIVQIDDSMKIIKSEAILLPIDHQLKTFFNTGKVLKLTLDHQTKLEAASDSRISHFLNGNLWKKVKKKFIGKTVIPIFLYNDDFGTDDGLSPHGVSNKVSGYYFNLPTLPPEYNSIVDNIFVAMLAKADEIKEVGVNKVIDVIVKTLKPLEENGLEIGHTTIHFAPVLLLGDNMALNLNLGLPGSHSATYFCRICFMEKSKTEICCKENVIVLRTQGHYEMCIKDIGKPGKNFGINSKCNFNELKSFEFTDNLVSDPMHDEFSGVFNYDILEIVENGIKNKKFTLDQFNKSKNEFDYGPKEVNYIAEDISYNKSSKTYHIRCHAREMWTLVNNLCFILGKLLRHSDPLYKFGLVMMDILDYTLKSSYSEQELQEFKIVIETHNRLLKGFRTLPPKAHHLLHYPRIIRNSGPLKNLMCMRFESKHQQLKSYSRAMFNRKNICLSLAKKISFHHAHRMMEISDEFTKIKDYSKIDIDFLNQFKDQLLSYKVAKKVNYCGTIYMIDDIIISNCLEFCFKILQIGIDLKNDHIILIYKKYKIEYEELKRSYKICEAVNILEWDKIESFKYPPINSHIYEGNFFLRIKQF